MTNFLLAGVGGQGILLASDVLAEVGACLGLDAKKAEIHGMSQRGGSVDSHVRWGEHVYSPVTPRGEVDYLLAFEMMEGARYLDYLAPETITLVSDLRVMPLTVASGAAVYPSEEGLIEAYRRHSYRVVRVAAAARARALGNPAVANVVLLGALAAQLDVGEAVWLETLRSKLPARFVDVNLAAFRVGVELALLDSRRTSSNA